MRVIDSHTAGEPTRVIIEGGPDLGSGTVAERALRLQQEFPDFYSSVLSEPRGHDAVVGALLVEPSDPSCVTGVIFFNTLQNLGMCGHASLGLVATLAYQGKITPGQHRFETPVGVVGVELHEDLSASVTNVESYRLHKDVQLAVEGYGTVTGDVAWGGNWFFLVKNVPIAVESSNIRALTDLALAIRTSLEREGITGTEGAWIDHIELFGPPHLKEAQSKSFVLCPGGAYDRSPCGTGCSAKIACLAADGAWPEKQVWIQESVIGSTYQIQYVNGQQGGVIPTITGRAFVTAECLLKFDPQDPYRTGIVL